MATRLLEIYFDYISPFAYMASELLGPLAAWLAQADDATTRSRLQALTAEADERGAFGVPTVVLDGELFWGVDSLPALDWRLRQPKTAPPGKA